MSLNIYRSYKEKTTDRLMTQPELFELIRTGDNNRSIINTIRTFNRTDEQYGQLKSLLPVVAWNVHFNNKKTTDHITALSGYMYLDKDGLTEDQINHYKEFLMTYPYVIAVWKSVGGRGFGCLIQVDNITKYNFKEAWNEINTTIGIDLDPGACKLTQLNVISYDPDIRINEMVTPYVFVSNNISVSGNTSNYTYTSSNTIHNNNINSDITNNIDYSGNTSCSDKVYDALNYRTCYIYGDNTPYEKKIDKPIIFKTKLDDSVFNSKQYVVSENGIDFLNVYTRSVIPESKRHTTLSAICSVLITLNPDPDSSNSLLNMFNYINEKRCFPPLPYQEVIKIFNYYYELNEKGKLAVKPGQRFIIFKENSGLSIKEKLSICGREGGKLKRSRTTKKIIDAIRELESMEIKATQKNIADHIKMSVRTVKGYWKTVMDSITS